MRSGIGVWWPPSWEYAPESASVGEELGEESRRLVAEDTVDQLDPVVESSVLGDVV
jgi:hypothetical protein